MQIEQVQISLNDTTLEEFASIQANLCLRSKRQIYLSTFNIKELQAQCLAICGSITHDFLRKPASKYARIFFTLELVRAYLTSLWEDFDHIKKIQYIWDHFQYTECKKYNSLKTLFLSKVRMLHDRHKIYNHEAWKFEICAQFFGQNSESRLFILVNVMLI